MSSSILNDIKKLLGIDEAYEAFDTDIRIHINSAFTTLAQLGVGPPGGFVITGKDETWSVFIPDAIKMESIKSYIYIKVRLLFDPPTNSFLVDSLNAQAKEYEWRLHVQAANTSQEGVP